jgi:hypothetical protein
MMIQMINAVAAAVLETARVEINREGIVAVGGV